MEITPKTDEELIEINESLRLIQKKNGIKFGTDSYLISALIKKNLSGAACDLGAGCGVISLFAAARCAFDEIDAVEIDPEFSRLCERNAALNGFENKIVSVNADVRYIKEKFKPETFSCVVSNPPYMKCKSGKDASSRAMNAARREENGDIYDFAKAASYLLKYGGTFYVVYRPERAAELIHAMKENMLEPKRLITVYPDVSSAPCLILIEAKKCAAPSVKFSRPLIIYNETRQYTKDMERVYNDFTLDHLFE